MDKGDVVFGMVVVDTAADADWVLENCTVYGAIQVLATGEFIHVDGDEHEGGDR